MLHSGGKTCWRRPADGDKSPELSVAEREPHKRDHLRKEKKKTLSPLLQPAHTENSHETESSDFKVYFLLRRNKLSGTGAECKLFRSIYECITFVTV